MGMRLGLAVATDIPVHVEIGDHTAVDKLGFHKLAREPDALDLVQLMRDRELDLARELRILAYLGGLDRVPEFIAILQLLWRPIRQHHLGVDDAGLVAEVVAPVEPLVVQPRGGAIGCRRQRAGARSAADYLGREVVDRHDG
jgi:hypothetical protein